MAGSNITLTPSNNAAQNRTDVTIAASGGGGGGGISSSSLILTTPEGLTISRPTSSPSTYYLDISPGRCLVPGATDRYLFSTSVVWSKDLDREWQQGNGAGGRLGSVPTQSNPWRTWHIFAMYHIPSGAVDFGFSRELDASDRPFPSDWAVRRIGSWLTDDSGFWRRIIQSGDNFMHAVPTLSVSANIPDTATLYTMDVPTGLNLISEVAIHPGAVNLYWYVSLVVTSPLVDDVASVVNFDSSNPTADTISYYPDSPHIYHNWQSYKQVITDTSGRIRARSSFGGAPWTVFPAIKTLGWIDKRI